MKTRRWYVLCSYILSAQFIHIEIPVALYTMSQKMTSFAGFSIFSSYKSVIETCHIIS